MIRARATGGPDDRIGSLFFNPGGPGVASVDLFPVLVRLLPAEIRNAFDIVTWDPRGVGRSAGLTGCSGGSYSLPPVGPVNWSAVLSEMRTTAKRANRACWNAHRDLVPYLGTMSTARDLDRLREAVGDQRLTYWGTSYGTRIGFVYAHLFPGRVRAMLLSSPVEPDGTWRSFALGSALSPENALGFFFEVKPEAREHFRKVVASLERRTLLLPSGHRFTRWDVRGSLGAMLQSESNFDRAADFLGAADSALNGSGAEQQDGVKNLDAMEWPSRYPINGGAVPFIGCADYAERLSADEEEKLAALFRAQAPVTGFAGSQVLFYCEGVPGAIDPVPTDVGNDKAPMLIIASTRDGLTQYGWANDIARNFPDSRIVTHVGTQHTPYLAGSDCIDRYGTDYLLTLKRPDFDVSCANPLAGN